MRVVELAAGGARRQGTFCVGALGTHSVFPTFCNFKTLNERQTLTLASSKPPQLSLEAVTTYTI